MTFERTEDMCLVREVMTHPRVWPFITDDGCPPVEEFAPLAHPSVIYLLCRDGDRLLGLWMFLPQNAATVEVHTCLLPGHGFRRSRLAAREAAEWIWRNTGAQRIFTNVPECNRIAHKFAVDAGMEEFGRNTKSFLKGGVLQDQIMLGVSRPRETKCQQQ